MSVWLYKRLKITHKLSVTTFYDFTRVHTTGEKDND